MISYSLLLVYFSLYFANAAILSKSDVVGNVSLTISIVSII